MMRIHHRSDVPNFAATTIRFEGIISFEPNSGCWLWSGCLDRKGYGLFGLRNYTERAHRASWLLYCGDIGDRHVLHKCDVRCCVNPDHLFLGTNHDNVLDMTKKGRGFSHKGQNCRTSKLTDEQVRDILLDPCTGIDAAQKYGVCEDTISRIRAGKAWVHISSQMAARPMTGHDRLGIAFATLRARKTALAALARAP